MKDIINFDAVRLSTELNKFQKHKSIPTSFFDGTFSLLDLKENYNDLSKKHQKIADKLISQYTQDINSSQGSLHKSFLNEYIGFLNNQCTRKPEWEFGPVMKKFRQNINPVRALIYDAKEVIKYFNHNNEHHMWLQEILSDKELNSKLLDCIVRDRKRVDKIINYYHPLYKSANIELPIEMLHLKQLRQDLLEYANFVTVLKKWDPK